MNENDVTKEGLQNLRPGRDALTGVSTGPDGTGVPWRRVGRRGEAAMVPDPEFHSYYGQPIINKPVWERRDIAGYLFLGGLAGASSLVAAAAQLTGRRHLARAMKMGSFAAVNLSLVALIHDLGRPARFLNMLRVFKPTSPMNVGSWLLAAFGTASAAAVFSEVSGRLRVVGAAGTAGAALLGTGVATYTAALVSNTAVPAWHDAYRDLPWIFASSAATSAAGLGLVAGPVTETDPVRILGIVGGVLEIGTGEVMERRMGLAGEAFNEGKAKRFHSFARALLTGGVICAFVSRRNRILNILSGAALLVGSAFTRFAIFEAGLNSAEDPRYTVVPQRQRVEARQQEPG